MQYQTEEIYFLVPIAPVFGVCGGSFPSNATEALFISGVRLSERRRRYDDLRSSLLGRGRAKLGSCGMLWWRADSVIHLERAFVAQDSEQMCS
jgi:hypothetical protein